MSRSLFITFEGGEGSGKTTQIKLLAEALKGRGLEVVTTREPGGTPEAEKIRDLLVKREGGDWTPAAEVLLLFAGRSMHVEKLIKPALTAGKVVICDRFADSTRAYQGYGHGFDHGHIETVNRITLGDFAPDLTFIMDIPAAEGLNRAGKRLVQDASREDRFESLALSFHEKLRQGYLAIARTEPDRCVVLDARQSVDTIAASLQKIVFQRLETCAKT